MAMAARLVLVEGVPPAPPAALPPGLVWPDLTMLALHGGRQRTEAEYRALLPRAGLEVLRCFEAGVEGRPAPARAAARR
jgi:hypothetical protein